MAAISIPGTGFGAGATASVEPASGAGKASEGMTVMLAGGMLGDIEASDGLGFGCWMG